MFTGLAFIFILHGLYAVKCWLGINLLKRHHFPDLVERWTLGLIRSEWVLHPKSRRKKRKNGTNTRKPQVNRI